MEPTGVKVTTTLRVKRYGVEIGAVLLLGVMSYFLFCIWGRRKNPA